MSAAERRRRDAARKRKEYWRDPVAARAKNHAKRQRRLDHYRAKERAAHRRNIKKQRAWARRATARYRERHPMIVEAWEATKAAIKAGKLVPATVCEASGCHRTSDLQVHHNTYARPTKPTSITTLCRACHRRTHADKKVRLRDGAARRWARAPQQAEARHAG
jgi:hypothetical protein